MDKEILDRLENLEATEDVATKKKRGLGASLRELAGRIESSALVKRIKQSPLAFSALFLALGLVLGWLIVGWLVFPVQWQDTDPWDLREEHRVRYIRMVADDYWRNGDTKTVYEAVDGWDETDLAELLGQLLYSNELSSDSRQHLVALAEALNLVSHHEPLLATLVFNHTAILVTAILSTLPMLLAVGLIVTPAIKKVASGEGRAELAEALAGALGGGGSEEDEEFGDGEGTEAMEQMLDGIDEFDDEDDEEDEEEMLTAEQRAAMLLGGGGSEEEDVDVGDMLGDLFDEDNEDMERLEVLSKMLADITIEDLVKKAKDLAQQLSRTVAYGRRKQ